MLQCSGKDKKQLVFEAWIKFVFRGRVWQLQLEMQAANKVKCVAGSKAAFAASEMFNQKLYLLLTTRPAPYAFPPLQHANLHHEWKHKL